MIIQHNMTAMNTQRQLNISVGEKQKAMEKLSSGYRINRAADDAAGLGISEKMRGQIRGLNRGTTNIEEGRDMCNVADGALAEVSNILIRINELSVQAANGTYTAADRAAINNEINALKGEINRIGTDTYFNNMKVFQGDLVEEVDKPSTGGGGVIPTTVTTDSEFFKALGGNVTKTGHMSESIPKADIAAMDNTGYNKGSSPNPFVGDVMDFGPLVDSQKKIEDLVGTGFYANCCTDCCPCDFKFTDGTGIKQTSSGKPYVIEIGLKKADGSYFGSANELCDSIVKSSVIENIGHVKFAHKPGESKLYMYDVDNNAWSEGSKNKAYFCDPMGFDGDGGGSGGGTEEVIKPFPGLHIQMSGNVNDSMILHFGELSTDWMGLTKHDVLTEESSGKMITASLDAQKLVNEKRSRIGAYVNRLESAARQNGNTSENTQAAESRIRDTDMATMMVAFSKYSILQQAGESMLAQANQSKQDVMRLLQNTSE